MTATRVLVLLILIATTYPSCAYYIEDAGVYPTNPKEGDTVTFICRSIYAYILNFEIIWSKNGNELTKNDIFVDDGFGNRTNTNVEWFRDEIQLTIDNVSRSDSGVYTCSLYQSLEYYYDRYSSDYLKLPRDEWSPFDVDVSYYPSTKFPMCAVKSNQTSTDFVCTSEIGNPGVSLHWIVESELITDYLPVLHKDDEHVESEFAIKNWQIRSTDVFTCTVNSSEFYVLRNCSLHGNNIFHAYIVPPSLTVKTPDAAKFTCQTNVEPINWFWKTEPQIKQSRQHLSTSQLRIEPVIAEDNGTSVSCYALFEDRWLQAHAELTVLSNSLGKSSPRSGSEHQGNPSLPWVVLFVVALIAFAISVTVNIICYRKTKNCNSPITLQQKSASADEPKVHEGIKVKRVEEKEEEYTDLNLENKASEDYTGLNVGAMSARYVNRGFKDNKKGGVTDAELYDYPEQDDQKRSKQDEEVYSNVEV